MPKEIGHYHLHSKHFQFLTIKIQITWKRRGLFTPWFLNIVDLHFTGSWIKLEPEVDEEVHYF